LIHRRLLTTQLQGREPPILEVSQLERFVVERFGKPSGGKTLSIKLIEASVLGMIAMAAIKGLKLITGAKSIKWTGPTWRRSCVSPYVRMASSQHF